MKLNNWSFPLARLQKDFRNLLNEHEVSSPFLQDVIERKCVGIAMKYLKDICGNGSYGDFLVEKGFVLPNDPKNIGNFIYDKIGLPISESKVIPSNKLLNTYNSPYDLPLRVTHWFNNSIIRYNGKLLMSYRMDMSPFTEYTRLAIVELEEDYTPIKSSNRILDLKTPNDGFSAEDGRLFVFKNKLHITYSTNYAGNNFSIGIAVIEDDFSLSDNIIFNKPIESIPEKNWLFFEYNSELYCLYNANESSIWKVVGNSIIPIHSAEKIKWDWGELRGGATPILHDDKLYHFFHTSFPIYDKQSKMSSRQFFMGCQVLEATPPFRTIFISKEPILTGEYSNNINYPNPSKVIVYPCGVVMEKDNWVISFGYQDYECRFIKLSNEYLKSNLCPHL